LTRVLQIALPAYSIIWLCIAWVQELPAIISFLATQRGFRAIFALSILILLSAAFALLAYGSIRRWRWAFWGYIFLLVWFAETAVQFGLFRTTYELFADATVAILLIASVIGLVRRGPWAMKKALK
jgi:hypothetical protein